MTTTEVREFALGDETMLHAGHSRALGPERPRAQVMTRWGCIRADDLELKTDNPTNRLERPNSTGQGTVDSNLV